MQSFFANASRERILCWGLAGALSAAAALLLAIAGLAIETGGSLLPVMPAILTLALVRLRTAQDRIGTSLFDCCELILIFVVMSAAGAIASHAIAVQTTGFGDPLLARADARLGFDWVALYRWWTLHPVLAGIGRTAYATIAFSPIAILAGAVMLGRIDRARKFLIAFASALTVALLLFRFFPGRATFAHYLGGHGPYVPAIGLQHVVQIEALRDGTAQSVSLASLTGLIAFPSFHACAALLMIWAAWPLRALRLPVLAVNGAMLAATPVEGAHYLIDMIGGGALALLAIAITERLVAGWPRRRSYARERAPFSPQSAAGKVRVIGRGLWPRRPV
jgi:hypothetical protein